MNNAMLSQDGATSMINIDEDTHHQGGYNLMESARQQDSNYANDIENSQQNFQSSLISP